MTRAAKTAIDISTSVPICSPSRISLHSELFLVAGDRVSCVRCCHQDLRKLPCVLRREVEPLSLGLVPLVAAPTEFDSLECHDHLLPWHTGQPHVIYARFEARHGPPETGRGQFVVPGDVNDHLEGLLSKIRWVLARSPAGRQVGFSASRSR